MIRKVDDTSKARIFWEFYLLQDYITGWRKPEVHKNGHTTSFLHIREN